MEMTIQRTYEGEVAALSLVRDVSKDEELTISYLSDSNLRQPTALRRALLQQKFNFVCECKRCGTAIASSCDEAAVIRAVGNQPSAAQQKDSADPETAESLVVLDAAHAAVCRQLRSCSAVLDTSATPSPGYVMDTVQACAKALCAFQSTRRVLLARAGVQ